MGSNNSTQERIITPMGGVGTRNQNAFSAINRETTKDRWSSDREGDRWRYDKGDRDYTFSSRLVNGSDRWGHRQSRAVQSCSNCYSIASSSAIVFFEQAIANSLFSTVFPGLAITEQ
jgi:hypothetical protein